MFVRGSGGRGVVRPGGGVWRCRGQQVWLGGIGSFAKSGWRDGLPAGWWTVRTCRKVGHLWRDLCLPCGNVVAVWGEVRFGSTEGGGCLFGAAGFRARFVWSVAFGGVGGSGFGLAGLDRLPGAAGRIACQLVDGAFGDAGDSLVC
ncbi:hypothetical protein BC440_01575 [Thalassospira sp. MIT1004]|nr:hypothetical protein [Thalassospira sp.]OHY99197.1 hypothetical protein BC440_01575 [Thalassospira sp. MIT1004]